MAKIEFRRFDASKALENDVNRNCNDHPECKNCPYEGYDSCKLLYLYEKTRDEYYHKGRADEQERIMSIVTRCIAHNVYNVSEGIALLNEIKEELKEQKE